MDEQKIKDFMKSKLIEKQKIVAQITELVMDMYEKGWCDCWKILTGQDFNKGEQK